MLVDCFMYGLCFRNGRTPVVLSFYERQKTIVLLFTTRGRSLSKVALYITTSRSFYIRPLDEYRWRNLKSAYPRAFLINSSCTALTSTCRVTRVCLLSISFDIPPLHVRTIMPSSTVKQRFEHTLAFVIRKLESTSLNIPRPVKRNRYRPYLPQPLHRVQRSLQLNADQPELIDMLLDAYNASLGQRYLCQRPHHGSTLRRREEAFEERFAHDESLWKKDVSRRFDTPRSYASSDLASRYSPGSYQFRFFQNHSGFD